LYISGEVALLGSRSREKIGLWGIRDEGGQVREERIGTKRRKRIGINRSHRAHSNARGVVTVPTITRKRASSVTMIV
jgi:hypothetical protein